jgi:hypothetical protein
MQALIKALKPIRFIANSFLVDQKMLPSEFEQIAECRNIGSAAPTAAEDTSIQSAVHACANPA